MNDAPTLTVVTPPGWWDLPLEEATLHADLERLVAERGAGLPEAVDRAAVTAVLEQAARSALSAGALFASQFGMVGEGVEFSASVLAAVHRGPVGEPVDRPVGSGEWDVSTAAVVLPAGPATRRCSRRRIGPVQTCQVQYFVPLATGSGDDRSGDDTSEGDRSGGYRSGPGGDDPATGTDAPTMLILSGSCVGIDDLDTAAGLFDRIAATVSFGRARDQP